MTLSAALAQSCSTAAPARAETTIDEVYLAGTMSTEHLTGVLRGALRTGVHTPERWLSSLELNREPCCTPKHLLM